MTFVETLKTVAGDYGLKLPPHFFAKKRDGHKDTDLQNLPGVRLAISNEAAEGSKLDDALVKDVTGGDTLVARRLYGRPYEFTPTAKYLHYGNEKPTFNVNDGGLRRRLHLVPFDYQFSEGERDRHFADKLVPEYPGILAWVVEGALKWRRDGLKPPAKVLRATGEYFDEQDPAKRFLDECTVDGGRAQSTDLHSVYEEWSRLNGEPAKTRRELMLDMKRLGYPAQRSNGKDYRTGRTLREAWLRQARIRNLRVVDDAEDDRERKSTG